MTKDMNHSEPILYVIYYIVDGRKHRCGDSYISGTITIKEVIDQLVEHHKLQDYLKEPQWGKPTLHTAPDEPPLDPSKPLCQVGIQEGSDLYLIITPTYLPITIHWSVGQSSGRKQLNLPTDLNIKELTRKVIDELGLREWVDGPRKARSSLCLRAEGPALPEHQNLLDLKLHANDQLWLKIEPTRLPVKLRWQEPDGDKTVSYYLDLSKTISGNLVDLERSYPFISKVKNGPEKCVISLRKSPQDRDLPGDKRPGEVDIVEESELWIVFKPTMAFVTLHYPTSDEGNSSFNTKQVTLPLDKPIRDVIHQVKREIGWRGPRIIQLAPSRYGPPWPDESHLADHHIHTGSDVWVYIPASVRLSWLVFATVVVVVIGIGLFYLLNIRNGGNDTSKSTAIVTPIVFPSPTFAPIATPTRTLDEQKRFDYALGREAYQQQNWLEAAAAFERVYALDPAYLDTSEILAATYYNWAFNILTAPDKAQESLELVRKTFIYSPTHQLARDLEHKLTLYIDGVAKAEARDWEGAISAFRQLYDMSSDFLDVSQQLYDALISFSGQLQEANDLNRALEFCQLASTLPIDDVSAARTCVETLRPTPTPTPTPRPRPSPEPPKLRVSLRDRNPNDPTCISIRVRFIDSTGWYLKADGLNLEATFRGGDARMCGLRPLQEFTFTIYNAQGRVVPGGRGIPARGGDIFYADWR